MRVTEVMSYRPIAIDAFATVQTAAQQMRSHVVGALPVVERGQLVGIITDRDVVLRMVAQGERPPWETYVREVMTEHPLTCRPDERLADAVERMVGRNVRRIIVVDEGGAVVGLVSVDDLVLLPETRAMALALLERIALRRGELDGVLDGVQP